MFISIFLNLVPSAPAQIVRAVNKTSTSILITWYEVPFGQKNGHSGGPAREARAAEHHG